MNKISYFLSIASLSFCAACSSIPKSVQDWRSNIKSEKIEEQVMTYKTYGELGKPVIVLLHGLPTSSYLYRNIAPSLAAKGFYVVTPDFVGFGASTKPDDFDQYEISKQARRLDLLLDRLHINKFSLVVHDLGAIVGFEYMLTKSSHITSLLILNTTAYKDGFTPPSEMKMLAGLMGGMMSSMMSGSLMGPYLTRKFIKDNMAHSDKLSEEARENYWWPIHEGTTSAMRATAKTFDKIMGRFPLYQEMLRNYKGKAHVYWGSQDKVLRYDKIGFQFKRDLKLSDKNLHQNTDASHFIQEDDPESVVIEILALVNQT